MKKILPLALLIVAVIVAISCTKNNDLELLFGKRVKFETNITATDPATRVADNVWDAQDAIGVYVFEESSETIVEGSGNIGFITNTGGVNGTFTAKDEPIYFPDNGDKVRFMSYYPYKSQITSFTYKVDVSNQTSQSAIDLLYSFDRENAYDKTVLNRTIPLSFDHKLTKIVINVKIGDDLENSDLKNLEVLLTGLNTKADFNLLEEELSNRTVIKDIIPFKQLAAKEGLYASYEAIVIPTDGTPENAKIVFDFNNVAEVESDVFSWVFGSALLGTYKYTYNVMIKRSEIIVLATINDWSDGGENNIDAQ